MRLTRAVSLIPSMLVIMLALRPFALAPLPEGPIRHFEGEPRTRDGPILVLGWNAVVYVDHTLVQRVESNLLLAQLLVKVLDDITHATFSSTARKKDI